MYNSGTYSVHVSNTLDCMGYNKHMINYRVQKYKELSDLSKGKLLNASVMIVGSKGEGLSAHLKSDEDRMVVIENITCDTYPNPRDTVFQMDTRDSPPGYTKLKLWKVIEDYDIENSLVHFADRGLYISSEIFLKYNALSELLKTAEITDQAIHSDAPLFSRSGPARTLSLYIDGIKVNYDLVPSFPCRHSCFLESWKNRYRDHNWPPLELVMNIQNTDIGYAVPVGPKGSDNQHLDWRLCFTTIEQKLIHSFNDTQSKVYVLLKMVAKSIIQPIFEDITSYVMKNIVLWMAELVPEEQFRDHLLIDRLIQALHYLQYCVQTNRLPSYMIPERNLIARKLTYPQRLKLEETLSEIIACGGSILFTCEQFKLFTVCMYKIPHQTRRFATKRDMIEKLGLLQLKVFNILLAEVILTRRITRTNYIDILCNNPLYCIIAKVLGDLVIPEWRVFRDQGMDVDTIKYYLNQGFYYYLS